MRSMLRIILFNSLFAVFFLGVTVDAFADDESPVHQASLIQQKLQSQEAPKVFEVTVKAIGASDSETFDLDSRLEDLGPKLKRLPFGTFKLLYESSETMSLLTRHKVALSNGQSLCLRPVDSNGNQITMWLKWKGEDGMSILDTRVNFALNESMIVGIEGKSEGTGTVLAISVTPKS